MDGVPSALYMHMPERGHWLVKPSTGVSAVTALCAVAGADSARARRSNLEVDAFVTVCRAWRV